MIQRRSPFTNTSLSSRKHDTCEVGETLQKVSWRDEGASRSPGPHLASLQHVPLIHDLHGIHLARLFHPHHRYLEADRRCSREAGRLPRQGSTLSPPSLSHAPTHTTPLTALKPRLGLRFKLIHQFLRLCPPLLCPTHLKSSSTLRTHLTECPAPDHLQNLKVIPLQSDLLKPCCNGLHWVGWREGGSEVSTRFPCPSG